MKRPTRSNTRTFVLTLVIALVSVACASRGTPAAGEVATVVVENTTVSSLTIWAVPETGARVRLGDVGANQTGTFRFNPLNRTYRFVAERLSGEAIASNPLGVFGGETVRWNLTGNIAIVDG